MAEPQPPRDEVFKRFDARYDALAESTRRKPRRFDNESGAEAGYRILGELFGGILGGLGLGWVVDRIAGTTPWGLVGGVVIGTVLAVYLIARSTNRMSGKAAPAEPRDTAPPGGTDKDGRDERGET